MKTANTVNENKAKIENLNGEISRMKRVLPLVKQFGARQKIGAIIRGYQQEIQSLRREIFQINY